MSAWEPGSGWRATLERLGCSLETSYRPPVDTPVRVCAEAILENLQRANPAFRAIREMPLE